MALFIGVMSGTSMDAVDTALVNFDADPPSLLERLSTPWPAPLRERLTTLAAGSPATASAMSILDADVGRFLASAIRQLLEQAKLSHQRVSAIGCHGQTVAHDPDKGATLQLGDANIVAEQTGIATVSDFRSRDMAVGGQGAPLAPAFHAAMLRAPDENRVILNLGGIANITVLPREPEEPVIGFDTGPANCLMDAWCRQYLGQPYDQDGAWAGSAIADDALLTELRTDAYFQLDPPKSTGTQYFSAGWLRDKLRPWPGIDPAVVQATLASLTSSTVVDAIERHAPQLNRLLVCGGGVRNSVLMRQLAEGLAVPVESTAAQGIDPLWMEPMAFAWLAKRTLEGQPGNLPEVTGACHSRILGVVHPA